MNGTWILVLDDDFREGLARSIRDLGYTVRSAVGSAEAFEELHGRPPPLAIVVEDSAIESDLLEALRAGADAPMILVSDSREALHGQPADAVLTKPVDWREFRKLIDAFGHE